MSIIIAIIIFSIMILFHEFGHFLFAKKNGIVVEEFSLGMGPKLISIERGGTKYCWKLLPFGGSCMMKGEDGDDNEDGSFNHASVWGRICVVAAGPVFNFILAFVAAVVIVAVMGTDKPYVTEFAENAPAEEAGLQVGDEITSINGYHVKIGRDLYMYQTLDGLDGNPITISYIRDGKKGVITYQPEREERYMLGFNYSADDEKAVISSVSVNMPMYKAGIAAEDVITAVNGTEIATGNDLSSYMQEHPMDGSSMSIAYEHKGKTKTVEVTPEKTTYAQLGFAYNLSRSRLGIAGTLRYSFTETAYWVRMTIKSLGMLLTGKVSVNDMSGPVGVVSAIGDTYQQSRSEGTLLTIMNMLNMIILLSANLGIMNLLPIPALDGGRLVFLIIEAIRGKCINRDVEGMIHFGGLMLLLALIVYVTFQDISKLL